MKNLWSSNHPRNFWQIRENLSDEAWQSAITNALPKLELSTPTSDINEILALTLGEGRFGPDHWELGSLEKGYYSIKPFIPRPITRQLRRFYHRGSKGPENWPIDYRFVAFQWEVLRQLLTQGDQKEINFRNFWPETNRYAFVLTHDIETAAGQESVELVADLEEGLGFRSQFIFVPDRYQVNRSLMESLRQRGFEVGVHGLKHDGKLFSSKAGFLQKAGRINQYLKEWNASGFRAELTHRQPEWMQVLNIEYDLSFFDTDPYEPIPGGTMSIWPFFIGHFVELPYTLVQDSTLFSILGQNSPRIWLEKVDYIEIFQGMALLNAHPDYLSQKTSWKVYCEFLYAMKERSHYWHALPCEVASWWKERNATPTKINVQKVHFCKVRLDKEGIQIEA